MIFMNLSTHLFRVVIFGVASAACIALVAGPAAAGYNDGSDEVYRGAGSEGAFWVGTLEPDYIANYVNTSNALGNNRCLDTFFDWQTREGHWDARIVRNCAPGTHRDSNGVFNENDASGPGILIGAKVAAGCIWNNSNNSYGDGSPHPSGLNCTKMQGAQFNASLGSADDWGDVEANRYVQIWIRFQGGNTEVKNGGDAWDPAH